MKGGQHGELAVRCNICGKEKKVSTSEYFKEGGLRGGCCHRTKQVQGVVVEIPCTWSTVKKSAK